MSLPSTLLGDMLKAWRGLLRRHTRFLLVAVSTLALGTAGCITVFALIQHTLLRPLPFPQPEQLVTVGLDPGDGAHISAPALYQGLRDLPPIEQAGFINAYTREVSVEAGALPVVATQIAADRGFLLTLAPGFSLGRGFLAEEDQPGAERVAVLTHGFWTRSLASNPQVLGQTLSIEGLPFTVIGVLAEGFEWPQGFDVLTALRLGDAGSNMDTNQYMVARLAVDTPHERFDALANARYRQLLDALAPQLSAEAVDFLGRLNLHARPLSALYHGDTGSTLALFMGAAACVLLIASFNLVNLLLVRSMTSSHASTVRAALGASPLRTLLPDLGEALLIGLLGSLAGLALAVLALGGLRQALGDAASIATPAWPGWQGSGLALAVGVGIALLAGLLGGLRKLRRTQARELVAGTRIGLAPGSGRLGKGLVIAQVAVAVVLLAAAGLFIRSLHQVSSVPMGFATANILSFSLSPLRGVYNNDELVRAQTRQLLDAIGQLPWVADVAVSSHLPTGARFNLPVKLPDGRPIQPQYRAVSETFFSSLGMTLSRGRGFSAEDVQASEAVAVVSQAFAEQHLQGDPLGQMLQMGQAADGSSLVTLRVVGVVSDVRQYGPTHPAPPILYVPIEQVPARFWPVLREFGPLRYLLRTRGEGGGREEVLRSTVQEVAPAQAIAQVRSLESVVDDNTRGARLQLLLIGSFALLALVMAGVGLYAVLAVSVAARMHEFGVRAALGADQGRLFSAVVFDSGRQVGIGLGIGVCGALALTHALQAFLFGVGRVDPLSLILSAVLLMAVAVVATAVPARRAYRADPAQVLRSA